MRTVAVLCTQYEKIFLLINSRPLETNEELITTNEPLAHEKNISLSFSHSLFLLYVFLLRLCFASFVLDVKVTDICIQSFS